MVRRDADLLADASIAEASAQALTHDGLLLNVEIVGDLLIGVQPWQLGDAHSLRSL